MAKSRKTPPTPTWAALAVPSGELLDALNQSSTWSSRLRRVGPQHDVLVLPLERGLAALDAQKVPVEHGLSLIADYASGKLIALVERGWANLWTDVDGVRVLPVGSWVLVPADVTTSPGSWAAAWLSRPPLPSIDLDTESGVDECPVERDPESLEGVPAGRLAPQTLHDGLAVLDGWQASPAGAAS
ncbi:hypothetical protein ACFXC8_13230 [Streptomyces sp. NPDC059441]|uniref:hypothetical protein n=1 Tax=Streptomyces sp. NPDC059441 TaxID=3346829 RepID=UPI00367ADD07